MGPTRAKKERHHAPKVITQLRLPELLHARIVVLAHQDNRAMNAWIVDKLEALVATLVQPTLFPKESDHEPTR
jgi:predicted HicB family RNase H-like nuclease